MASLITSLITFLKVLVPLLDNATNLGMAIHVRTVDFIFFRGCVKMNGGSY